MDLFGLKQTIDPTVVLNLVAEMMLAELADEWLIVVVYAMRSLHLAHLAPDPILEAEVVDEFDASHALADIKKRVILMGCCFEAEPADGLIGPFRVYALL